MTGLWLLSLYSLPSLPALRPPSLTVEVVHSMLHVIPPRGVLHCSRRVRPGSALVTSSSILPRLRGARVLVCTSGVEVCLFRTVPCLLL